MSSTITVVIADGGHMINLGTPAPAYRTVRIELTPDQHRMIQMRDGESVCLCVLDRTEGVNHDA